MISSLKAHITAIKSTSNTIHWIKYINVYSREKGNFNQDRDMEQMAYDLRHLHDKFQVLNSKHLTPLL